MGRKRCPGCGAICEDSAFCFQCGANLSGVAEELPGQEQQLEPTVETKYFVPQNPGTANPGTAGPAQNAAQTPPYNAFQAEQAAYGAGWGGEGNNQSTVPQAVAAVEPVKPRKSAKKPVLIIGIAAGAVLIALLVACLVSFHSYTVTFNPNGGTVLSGETEQKVRRGEAAEAPEVEQDGYFFESWDTDYSRIRKNTEVTAQWTRGVAVTFDLNGGELVSGETEQLLHAGESAEAPEVTREGFEFAGWDGDYTMLQDDVTVTAQWNELFTITFDPGEGELTSGEAEQQVAAGSLPEAPEAAREYYDFTGWDPEVTEVTGDALYTAQWAKQELDAETLYALVSPSVVEIHVYDEDGTYFAQGSGFFLDDSGTVATNYHVIENARTAEVYTVDEQTYEVEQVIAWDEDLDLAILKCSAENTQPVEICSSGVSTGETVYTLGSSLGLTGTFSDGLVSTASRDVEGVDCIQTTAPISSGNSGGPLINVYGEVVGINSMTLTNGQNLNFAINVQLLDELDRSNPYTMQEFYDETYQASADYMDEEAAELLDETDETEVEPNGAYYLADELENGKTMGGHVSLEDSDAYTFEITTSGYVTIVVIPYYRSESEYLVSGVVDSDEEIVTDDGHGGTGILLETEDDDGNTAVATEVWLEAGTYYLIVGLDDDEYPSDETGVFYEIVISW